MPRFMPRRRLRCHYCGDVSPNDHGIFVTPRSWLCPHCESVNHLDEYGQITDPPVETTTSPSTTHVRYGRSPSPMEPSEPPFCNTCLHNQMLVNQIMSEYIPDESDPSYHQRVASADAYRASQEQIYPQVCETCIGPVNEQIRAAGYTAKADAFARMVERSKKNLAKRLSPTQIWTLRLLSLAKWTYILSIFVGLLWHTFGALISPMSKAHMSGDYFTLVVCTKQAFLTQEVEQGCLHSRSFQTMVRFSLIADLLTIWWNPRLEQKTVRRGGRLRRLKSLWSIRVIVLAYRLASFIFWYDNAPLNEDTVRSFRHEHIKMLVLLASSILVTYILVHIEYQSTASFMRPVDSHLPNNPKSVPGSAERRTRHKLTRSNPSTFDSMPHSFMSSFSTTGLNDDTQLLPPSPTLTTTSTDTYESDGGTPYVHRNTKLIDDNMDWTPTAKKFCAKESEILPPVWDKPTPAFAPKAKHSIFAKPDPNPFRHKVPARPQSKFHPDPWKQGAWNPPVPQAKENFFQKMMNDASPSTRENLVNEVVPKRVQRDAEIFRSPQLKYDNYGTPKETGLEDTFNNLFSN